jgi:hypothetical protein
MGDPPSGRPGDALPPLAQLKALRALQADVMERTAAFDKTHPNPTKLTQDETVELEALRQAQTDVADLVRELAPAPKVEQKP